MFFSKNSDSNSGLFRFFKRGSQDQELLEIFENKGFYSEEYVNAFLERHPRPNSDDHFTLCEIYTEMGKYEDARTELMAVRPGSILDAINNGQHAFCSIALLMETGEYKKAISAYHEHVKFLDTFMKNSVRSRIAGDYYSHAAVICAIEGDEEKMDRYIRRMREWCDIFPKHRILLEVTQVKILFAKNKEEAGQALADCRQTITDFPGFKYEWEREYFLKKLDRAEYYKDAKDAI